MYQHCVIYPDYSSWRESYICAHIFGIQYQVYFFRGGHTGYEYEGIECEVFTSSALYFGIFPVKS